MNKKLVGTSYVARTLGISEVRVRQIVDAGKLKVKHQTFDGRRFYDPTDVERLRQDRERRSLGAQQKSDLRSERV
jgi:DNA-binding transcriptional MerR regulator